jgi:hypothetical protein
MNPQGYGAYLVGIILFYGIITYVVVLTATWIGSNWHLVEYGQEAARRYFLIALGKLNQCKKCRCTFQPPLEKCPMCCPGYYHHGFHVKKRDR